MHHSACMHQKHLLRFIKSKLRKEPGEVVIFRDGKYLTLLEVFESLNLTGCASPFPLPPSLHCMLTPTSPACFDPSIGVTDYSVMSVCRAPYRLVVCLGARHAFAAAPRYHLYSHQ